MIWSHRSRARHRLRAAATGVVIAAVLVLPGCSTPAPLPDEPYVPVEAPRTTWTLRHRVLDVKDLHVVSQRLSSGEESTEVALVNPANRQAEDCYVVVSDPGNRGPDTMTGEKITTTFDGHPAVRNGAGAEADYLMWQLSDGSWVQVSCASFGSRNAIDRVAAAVEFERTTLRVPFDLSLPEGYQVSSVQVDLVRPGAELYLQNRQQHRGSDGDVMITYGFPDPAPEPTGEPTTIGNHSALTDDGEIAPTVWIQEQGQWILVSSYAGDTGPYPDRSHELPMLESLAASLVFARDLRDPKTWFSAEYVFG